MELNGRKRKVGHGNDCNAPAKRVKSKKKWRVPRKSDQRSAQRRVIEPGDSGIWATCEKGKESKCIGELRDLFDEYAQKLHGGALNQGEDGTGKLEMNSGNIEGDIEAEIDNLHRPLAGDLFTPIRVDVQCVVFFRTAAPIEPVSFVKKICEDAMADPFQKRTRFAKRLSPMALMGRASAGGLDMVALQVLPRYFHRTPFRSVKFAIRPTIRNHNTLNRDGVIKQIATIIGPGHSVDLNNYDLLVIVEIYQNVCGVSVLDHDYNRLKRLNLAEIYDPSLRDVIAEAGPALAPAHGVVDGEAREDGAERHAGAPSVEGT